MGTGPPPLFLSLEPVLRCPNRRCRRIAFGISSDLITIKCAHCGANWWATRFPAGNLRIQILEQFDGDTTFVAILDLIGAPTTIDSPMFWQLWITGHEIYQFTDRRLTTTIRERSRSLMGRLTNALHRRAS